MVAEPARTSAEARSSTAFDAGPDRSPFVVEFEVGVAEVGPDESPAAVLERASQDIRARAQV